MTTKKNKSANIGEWSELYALAYILVHGGLYGSDSQYQRNNIFYKVSEVIVEDKNKENIFYRLKDNKIEIQTSKKIKEIRTNELEILLNLFLEKLKDFEKKSSGEVGSKILSLLCKKNLKAPSLKKIDIYLKMIDQTGKNGFSIKSTIGSPDSLINASKSTNFIYEIVDENNKSISLKSHNQLENIIKDHQDKFMKNLSFEPKEIVRELQELGYKFKFIPEKLKDEFKYNLNLIDSKLPLNLSSLVESYYSLPKRDVKSIEELIYENKIETKEKNKIIEYLIKSAFVMIPSKKWDGIFTNKDGFILVEKDGHVRIISNNLEDYIIANYKFDTGSTKRYKIGRVYEEREKVFIQLNLQIRSLS